MSIQTISIIGMTISSFVNALVLVHLLRRVRKLEKSRVMGIEEFEKAMEDWLK